MALPFTPNFQQHPVRRALMACIMALSLPWAAAQTPAQVHERAKAQTQALLGTLKDLVSIESGSRDLEGLEKIAALIATRLQNMFCRRVAIKAAIFSSPSRSRLPDSMETRSLRVPSSACVWALARSCT